MFFKSKIGLCLTAGGAKGLCHIGVIETLEANNISIHAISGTSIGALIGGVYAYTKNIDTIKALFLSMTKKKWYKCMVKDLRPTRKGFLSGNYVEKLLRDLVPSDAKIEDCKIPFRCIAADILTGREIVFVKGNLIKAIRASISIPVTFRPVRLKKYLLVDGTCVNPAPVQQLEEMGCDKTILSSICSRSGNKYLGGTGRTMLLHNYMANSTASLIRSKMLFADVVLCPDVSNIDTLDFWKGREGIDAGINSSMENIEKIKNLVRWWR